MTSLPALLESLERLALPAGEYAITGSGPLAVRGVRAAADLDVIVSDALWQRLCASHVVVRRHGVTTLDCGAVTILGPGSHFTDSAIMPVSEQIASAEWIDGHPYVALPIVRQLKVTLGRPKDLADVALIDQTLAREAQGFTLEGDE